MLRKAACDELSGNAHLYRPFYAADVGYRRSKKTRAGVVEPVCQAAYEGWVSALRGSDESDQLVVVALARCCRISVQVIVAFAYVVSFVDPAGVGRGSRQCWWENYGAHWVQLIGGGGSGGETVASASAGCVSVVEGGMQADASGRSSKAGGGGGSVVVQGILAASVVFGGVEGRGSSASVGAVRLGSCSARFGDGGFAWIGTYGAGINCQVGRSARGIRNE